MTLPTEQDMRDAGFQGKPDTMERRSEVALRLLCAFVGVDWKTAPPAWWYHPNASTKAAWERVANEAKEIFSAD